MSLDVTLAMLVDEARHALVEVRTQRYYEAERTLEGVILAGQLVERWRRRDPQALRMAHILRSLEWEWTPEARLEWERLHELRRIEWERSPEWLRQQAALMEVERANSAI